MDRTFASGAEAVAHYGAQGYRTLEFVGHGNADDARVMENYLGDKVVIRHLGLLEWQASEYPNHDA